MLPGSLLPAPPPGALRDSTKNGLVRLRIDARPVPGEELSWVERQRTGQLSWTSERRCKFFVRLRISWSKTRYFGCQIP